MDEESGTSISSDNYMSGYDGLSSTTIVSKKTPIIFGSPSSVLLSSGNIKIPSMGMMTNRYKHQPMSLEFWIKPVNGLAAYPRTQIVQLSDTANGIYVENSSFVAIIGDNLDKSHKIVIPVENFNKPFHIVMTYSESAFGFYVNGEGSSVPIQNDIFTDEWSNFTSGLNEKQKLENADQFFYFKSISGKPYALDNIAIYTYPMDILTARRHMVYGLGYEAQEGFETHFGGYRYSLSMERTPVYGKVEKYDADTWLSNSQSSNLVCENGFLRINKLPYPEMKYTTDKDSTVFSWSSDALYIASGGYLQINPKQIDFSNNGFASVLTKDSATQLGTTQTLLLLQDPLNKEYFIKIYLQGVSGGERLYYQINNGTPVDLRGNSTAAINTDFTVGYFYDYQTDSIKLFASYSSSDFVATISGGSNTRIFTTSHASVLRIGSNDSFSDTEAIADIQDSERFTGGIKRIVQMDTTVSTSILTDISTRINKYTAIANHTEKRFIIKAKGKLIFKVDAKRLAGPNNIIGPNRVEWGYDGPELSVSIDPIGATNTGYATYQALLNAFTGGTYQDLLNTHNAYAFLLNNPEINWFTSGSISNRTTISQILGVDSGVTKAVQFTLDIECEDVIDNPTKISYFRVLSFACTESAGVFTSEIGGYSLPLKYTFTSANKDFNLPEYKSTPFLWCEEDGGFKVGRTAYIEYTSPPFYGEEVGGLFGLSFFLNIPDDVSRTVLGGNPILTITKGATTATLEYDSINDTLKSSGGQIFLNGSTTGSTSIAYTTGTWQHVIFRLNSLMSSQTTSYPIIKFGADTGTSDFYIDEIMTFSRSLTADEIEIISGVYRGVYVEKVNGSVASSELYFDDQEISNSTEIYQPFPDQTSLQDDVDLATYSSKSLNTDGDNLEFLYTGPNSLLIDGTYMQDQERILIKNQNSSQNGIFIVNIPDELEPNVTSITLTRQTCPTGSVIYVKDGVSNKGRHFLRTGTNTFEETYFLKKVDAYTYEGSRNKTDLVARKTVTV